MNWGNSNVHNLYTAIPLRQRKRSDMEAQNRADCSVFFFTRQQLIKVSTCCKAGNLDDMAFIIWHTES